MMNDLLRDKILLHGSGDHARVVLDCLLEQQVNVIGIFDPKVTDPLFGIPQIGKYDPALFPGAKTVIAIGNNLIRKKIAEMSVHGFTKVVHSSALISSNTIIGEGSMILHRTTIQVNSKIGKHVIINTGAQVDHDCMVDDYVHVAPGAILCGTVSVGEGSFIGAGTVIIPGIKIGKWAVIGAGSVIIRNVPDYSVAVGNPARVIKNLAQ
jgi:sugar O-acyltransferase (sialic acid O-acetyltransferase NeuD family)